MKTTSKILAAVLALAMLLALAACGKENDPSGTTTQPETTITTQASTSIPTEASSKIEATAPAGMTADEARDIYAAWLEDHTELADYALGDEDETYEWQGAQYHLFHAENPTYYWYNILVDMETGELLFMMMSDGEFPETTVQPLDGWYAETFE